MQISDAIRLIQSAAIKEKPASWVDLGCGNGVFTKALASLLPAGSHIHAVDKTRQHIQPVPEKTIHFHLADFSKDPLPFSSVDGILMANALHYVKDKLPLLEQLKKKLLPDATFIIVEYDITQANHWVPYPINYIRMQQLFLDAGFSSCKKLGERPSVYQRGNLYACQASSM